MAGWLRPSRYPARVTDLSRMMASNTTSRFRSIAPNLGAALFKRPELQLIIQIEHVGMKRMHFSNAKLNPKHPVVGWTARAFSGCAGHPPLRGKRKFAPRGPTSD